MTFKFNLKHHVWYRQVHVIKTPRNCSVALRRHEQFEETQTEDGPSVQKKS